MPLKEQYVHLLSVDGYNQPLTKQEEYILDFIDNVTNDYTKSFSFFLPFVDIIIDKIADYYNHDTAMGRLKVFLEDMQQGGCQSGIIGDFVYNSDCKDFYIQHIDDVETYMEDYERDNGITLSNTTGQPRYVFACWFCFENFCSDLLSNF